MDLTLFLFNSRMELRQVITRGISQCVHGERSHTLSAELPTRHQIEPGEYLGFVCVDGRFRMFCVEYADEDDTTGMTAITAKDAAVDELDGTIVSITEPEEDEETGSVPEVTARAAILDVLNAIGWRMGTDETDAETAPVQGGMQSAWAALANVENAHNLWIAPYYTFDGAKITGRVLDVMAKRPVYRGRFVERGSDAEGIAIARGKRPKPKIYPVGADGLTIADVAWSKAQGDPVDKPLGQAWIGVPEAVDAYGGRGQVVEFGDITDENELIEKAWERAKKCTKPEVTATATISDMEMIAGQTWKSMRMWDVVRVRPKFGADVEEQIIDIARNYVRSAETKITLGKEPESASQMIRAASAGAATARVAAEKVGSRLRDLNVVVEELDYYTRTTITDAWVELEAGIDRSFAEIGSRVERMDRDIETNEELTRTVNESVVTLENDLEEARAQIAARFLTVEGEHERLAESYAEFVATDKEAKAQITARLTNNENELGTLSESYAEFVATDKEAKAQITARLGENEAELLLQATNIGTLFEVKADTTVVRDLVADRVDAEMAVFMEQIAGELNVANLTSMTFETGIAKTTLLTAEGQANFNGFLYANAGMEAASVETRLLTFKDNPIKLAQQTVLTSPKNMRTFSVFEQDGNPAQITAFQMGMGTANCFNTKTIYYLSWEASED